MGILRYIFTGNTHDINNYQKDHEKFEKNLNKFLESNRTKDVLNEYNFSLEKLKNIIEKSYRLGIYNIIFILNRGKILWEVLDVYTKSPSDWTEEDRFVKVHNFLNQYNIYK